MVSSIGTLEFSENTTFVPLIATPAAYTVYVNNTKTVYIRAYDASAGCYTSLSELGIITITLNECFDLLDCDLMGTNKTVDEDAPQACVYTHNGTTWDAELFSLISPNPFSNVKYYINGTLCPTGATLNGAVFPVGVNLVKVVAYYGTVADSCYFNVTVNRVCPARSGDDGDGNDYPVYSLAGLCWTANLFTTSYMNTNEIEFAEGYEFNPDYPDADANIAMFGRLYTWYSAVGVTEGDDTALPAGDCQGICPDGWRLPTIAELNSINVMNANDLKSKNNAHWVKPGTDEAPYKFDARGAGKYDAATDRFVELKGFTGYWACDANTGNVAPYISITYYCENGQENVMSKADGLSVRCVLDNIPCP
jgi:uncharacterized protein (TIGR02145 family)